MVDCKRILYIHLFIFSSIVFCSSLDEHNLNFYEPTKISSDIIIDGNLDEKEWQYQKSIEDLIQVAPNMLAHPTEKTSVKILYNDRYIYFGIVLYQDKNSISFKMGEYDDFSSFDESSDYFAIELDTQNNHDNAYGFLVNASNVKADYMVIGDEDGDIDDYWNASWISDVVVQNNSWVIEVAIPLSELRFSTNSKQEWGLNLMRYVKSKNETSFWSFIPALQNKFISSYGHLINLDIKYINSYKLTPYFLTGELQYNDIYYEVSPGDGSPTIVNSDDPYRFNKGSKKNKIGFDFKYSFRSNNVIDFTYNPDYGQINQDPSIINNTAYEIEFDEKRLFFLENSNFYQTPIKLFYSRRIGGSVVKQGDNFFDNIIFKTNFKTAVSYLGNKNNIQYGFLYAESKIKNHNFVKIYNNPNYDDLDVKYYVFRNKYKIFDNGFIGFMSTYYDKPKFEYIPPNSNMGGQREDFSRDESNTVTVDFNFNVLESIRIDGQIAQVENDGRVGSAFNLELDYSNYFDLSKHIDLWFKVENYDPNFDISKMGYLYRNDLKDLNVGFAFSNQNPHNAYNRKIILKYLFSKNYNNKVIQNTFDISFNNTFKNYYKLSLGFAKDFKHYIDRFYDAIHFESNPDIYTKGILYDKFFFELSNDQRLYNSYKIGFEYFIDNFNDNGNRLMFFDRYKINDRLEVEFSFDEKELFSKYHFLKMKRNTAGGGGGINRITSDEYDYLFVNSNNQEKTFSFQVSSQYTENITIQFYYEFYKYLNDWDTTDIFVIEKDNLNSYPVKDNNISLDVEEDGIIYISNYSSVIANFVIKAKLFSNSNFHFVYSLNKGINGRSFNNPFDVLDFSIRDINEDNLAEIYYEKSFFIKYDILFNN